ncbi:hypothetical protein Shyhy01_42810 [Streptomyces hygroscopicus subsp. hygroscopicus]|nr:hypothetical protein Shyhy01_42810 [Streptomyces hygroscopicus subsp. hygroscopicus]
MCAQARRGERRRRHGANSGQPWAGNDDHRGAITAPGLPESREPTIDGQEGPFGGHARHTKIDPDDGSTRRAWRLAQADAARARAGLPATDETTLVTASSWTYLSSGYRPGEEFLAAQVRHDIAHTQRLKQEGDFS